MTDTHKPYSDLVLHTDKEAIKTIRFQCRVRIAVYLLVLPSASVTGDIESYFIYLVGEVLTLSTTENLKSTPVFIY